MNSPTLCALEVVSGGLRKVECRNIQVVIICIEDACRCEETDDVGNIFSRIQSGFICDSLEIGGDVSRRRCRQIRRVGRQAFPVSRAERLHRQRLPGRFDSC